MPEYIEWNVDVKGDSNCDYCGVSTFLHKGEENHTFVRQRLIKELKVYKESYTNVIEKNILIKFMNILFLMLSI